MSEYRIEHISKEKTRQYIPAQVIGDKKIIRTTVAMSIKECKEYINDYKLKHTTRNQGKWILLHLCD